MLTEEELNTLKWRVLREPETCPSHRLLIELEELLAAKKAEERRRMRDSLAVNENLSEDECYQVIAAVERGQTMEFEEGPCRACQGRGSVFLATALGSGFERCRKCKGHRTVARIKVPE